MTLEPTMYMNEITENTSGVTFLLPFIKRTSHRSTLNKSMGRILTDLTENGKKDYRDYRVPSLPVGCNGSSFRAGVVNTLLPFMPEYMVSIATGHDGGSGDKQHKHLYDYVRGSRANLIPSGNILGGDDPFPFGQNGMPRKPESFSYLPISVSEEMKEKIVDFMCNITNITYYKFQRGGSLRPLLNTGVAAQIMYYRERKQKGNNHITYVLFYVYSI